MKIRNLIIAGIFIPFLLVEKKQRFSLHIEIKDSFKNWAEKANLDKASCNKDFSMIENQTWEQQAADFGLYTFHIESFQKSQEIDPQNLDVCLKESCKNLGEWYYNFQYYNEEIIRIAALKLDNEINENKSSKKMNELIQKYFKDLTGAKQEKYVLNHFITNYNNFALHHKERKNFNFCNSCITNLICLIECIRLASINLDCLEKMDFNNRNIVKKICFNKDGIMSVFKKYVIFKHLCVAIHIKYINLLIIRMKIFSHFLNSSLWNSFIKEAIPLLTKSAIFLSKNCKKEQEKYLDFPLENFNDFTVKLPKDFLINN